MTVSLLQIGLFSLGTAVLGLVIGWIVRSAAAKKAIQQLNEDWQSSVDDVSRQRDRATNEIATLRTTIENQQSLVAKHEHAAARGRTELESAREKNRSLMKDIFTKGEECDELKTSLGKSDNELAASREQFAELEAEFIKAGEFYKGELEKGFEKRKVLEAKLDDARAEQDSLRNLLDASRAEHQSVTNMLASAQNQLDSLDDVEQKVITLEADNAHLKHESTLAQQEIEALKRDVVELEALKVQNQELSHCLKSMEASRRQYEEDAKRYRDQADQTEKMSETLRLKLDDVEKSFSEMAKQQEQALKIARDQASPSRANGSANDPDATEREYDDLTEIVGIGKVFQQTLHNLGIYSFRQIAAFGPADIARVNMELKEFKGRMEQDDWIGQAKELLYKKHGDAAEA